MDDSTKNENFQLLRRSCVFHLSLILAFIYLADALFYGRQLGCNVAIYGLSWTAAIAIGCRKWARPTIVIAALVASLLVALLEYPGILPIIFTSFGLITLALAEREGWNADAILWMRRWSRFFKYGWFAWLVEIMSIRWRKILERGAGLGKWIIPSFLGLIFLGLFAVANPIIENWYNDVWRFFATLLERFFIFPDFGRIFLWTMVGIWGIALLRMRTNIQLESKIENTEGMKSKVLSSITSESIVRCLLVFNLVFAVQTTLDIIYLWGGASLPAGMTHAQYAHRGAYPLVATALLAAVFVLVTFRSGENPEGMRTARRLVYSWLTQNIFLVISAGWRLNLYISVYTLSRMRVAAALWMFLVVMGLLWICRRIFAGKSNTWLININFLTLLAVLYISSFVNFDGAIASYNVRHCKEITKKGIPLDVSYLQNLGPESLPALRWFVAEIDRRAQAKVSPSREENSARQKAEECIDFLEKSMAHTLKNWRGWNYRYHRLSEKTGDKR